MVADAGRRAPAMQGQLQTAAASHTSTDDISLSRCGGFRLGRPGSRGRTRDQLYNEARQKGIEGRSKMTKAQLQRAVDGR